MGDIRHRWLIALLAVGLTVSPFTARNVAADGLAVDDTYPPIAEDSVLTVPADMGVLTNDTGGSVVLCVVSVDTTGLQGAVDLGGASDGSFTYTPPLNFNGTTSFTYAVGTKVAEVCPAPPVNEGTAKVTITVTAVNDAPIANGDSFAVLKDRTLNVGPPGLLANDTDVDGDQLTAVAGSAPSHGTVTIAANGGFSYTPNAGYTGPDVFSYRASDGQAQSQLRAVSLTVAALPATPSPAPLSTPTPAPPTASPGPSPSASPLPSDSGPASALPVATGSPATSPSAGPVTAPAGGEGGGPPLLAILGLALLAGLLGVAGYFFVRSQREQEEDQLEPEYAPGPDLDDEGPPRS